MPSHSLQEGSDSLMAGVNTRTTSWISLDSEAAWTLITAADTNKQAGSRVNQGPSAASMPRRLLRHRHPQRVRTLKYMGRTNHGGELHFVISDGPVVAGLCVAEGGSGNWTDERPWSVPDLDER